MFKPDVQRSVSPGNFQADYKPIMPELLIPRQITVCLECWIHLRSFWQAPPLNWASLNSHCLAELHCLVAQCHALCFWCCGLGKRWSECSKSKLITVDSRANFFIVVAGLLSTPKYKKCRKIGRWAQACFEWKHQVWCIAENIVSPRGQELGVRMLKEIANVKRDTLFIFFKGFGVFKCGIQLD